MRFCLALLIVGFTWVLGYVQTPAQPQPDKKPRVDAFGDPLPEGAVARLGTVRWRQEIKVEAIAFAPDGKMVASAGSSLFSFTIWDAATGAALHRAPVSWRSGSSVAFSPDGKLLVVGGAQGVMLFGVGTGKEIRQLDGVSKCQMKSVAISSDGKTVAAGGQDPEGKPLLVLWNVLAGVEQRRLECPGRSVNTVAFSPDGKTLACGGNLDVIRLWDVDSGKELREFKGHTKGVDSVAFSPNGKTIASAGKDFIGRVWDSDSGKLLHELRPERDGVLRVHFSPDGKLLATCGQGGELRLWDPRSGKELRRWSASNVMLNCLAFSPDGKSIVSGGKTDHAIRHWDTNTGQELKPAQGHTGIVFGPLIFSRDGSKLISVGQDNRIVEWDLATSRQMRFLVSGSLSPAEDNWNFCAQTLTRDAKILVRAGLLTNDNKGDPSIRVWSLAENKEIAVLLGHKDKIDDIRFSPDDKILSSLGPDGVCLWDMATFKKTHFFPKAHSHQISPDGKLLVLNRESDSIVRLIEIESEKEIRYLDPGLRYPSFTFSPDGKSLLISGWKDEKPSISLWAVHSGKELIQLEEWGSLGHRAFSPNGRVLALNTTTSELLANGERKSTTTTRLCDAWTGQEIRQINLGQAYIRNLTFSSDGSLLASGGSDSTIMLWDATGRLMADGSQLAGPTAAALPGLWADLEADAPKVDRAIWALASAPALSVPFLKERIQPQQTADEKTIAKIFGDLGGDRFADRQKAFQDLEKLGESAEASVRKHLEGKITLEARQRLQQFLDNRGKEVIRKLRAIETLEHIGTAEARQVLQALAKESPSPRVAEFATSALTRLAKRGN